MRSVTTCPDPKVKKHNDNDINSNRSNCSLTKGWQSAVRNIRLATTKSTAKICCVPPIMAPIATMRSFAIPRLSPTTKTRHGTRRTGCHTANGPCCPTNCSRRATLGSPPAVAPTDTRTRQPRLPTTPTPNATLANTAPTDRVAGRTCHRCSRCTWRDRSLSLPVLGTTGTATRPWRRRSSWAEMVGAILRRRHRTPTNATGRSILGKAISLQVSVGRRPLDHTGDNQSTGTRLQCLLPAWTANTLPNDFVQGIFTGCQIGHLQIGQCYFLTPFDTRKVRGRNTITSARANVTASQTPAGPTPTRFCWSHTSHDPRAVPLRTRHTARTNWQTQAAYCTFLHGRGPVLVSIGKLDVLCPQACRRIQALIKFSSMAPIPNWAFTPPQSMSRHKKHQGDRKRISRDHVRGAVVKVFVI